jgi:SAM-dependent methyltransferase
VSRSEAPTSASVLGAFASSGLDRSRLHGNSAKLRLTLDVAAALRDRPALRVLDVGCAGPAPLNLWEPFVPLADRLELVGIDVAGVERARERARELGLRLDARELGAHDVARAFGRETFDAVVCTQVLEHLPDWRGALAAMRDVLRPGARLYVTCDSGELARSSGERARLTGKRAYARVWRRLGRRPPVGRGLPSGEWELAPTLDELRAGASALGLEVERAAPYCLRDAKIAQRRATPAARELWVAFEEALVAGGLDPDASARFTVLYVRARRPPPAAEGQPPGAAN